MLTLAPPSDQFCVLVLTVLVSWRLRRNVGEVRSAQRHRAAAEDHAVVVDQPADDYSTANDAECHQTKGARR